MAKHTDGSIDMVLDPSSPGVYPKNGTAAVEFAIVFPVLLLLVFGILEFSRAIWTEATLRYAVQAAARCAAVDPVTCGTSDQIQRYAVDKMPGFSPPDGAFTVTTQTCGKQVTGSLDFLFIVPALFPHSPVLSATSCYPI